MASTYPGALDNFATTSPANLGTTDSTGRTHSQRHNDTESAIEAIETELGTDPAGPFATVKSRLDLSSTPYHLPMIAGSYHSLGFGSTTASGPSEAREYVGMVFIPRRSCTIDRIAASIGTGGGVGETLRFAIRSMDESTGLPGAVLAQVGSVNAESTGAVEGVVSLAVTAGTPYAVTVTAQGASGTTPMLIRILARLWSWPEAAPSADTYHNPYSAAGQTGTLPDSQSWTLGSLTTFRLWVRTSA